MMRQAPTLPSQLGSYELRTKLAIGGFSEVWLARQQGPMGFVRPCALKVLRADFVQDEAARKALMAEARLLARFDHPNIMGMLEFGLDAGSQHLYYAMPYVAGRTLVTLTERARQSPYFGMPEALWISAKMCSALHYVHSFVDPRQGPLRIVHRDISPENVLVGHDGSLRLIDFGIALSGIVSRDTRARRVKGKAQYLSPEQARGVQELDARTDIYAAGLVLYLLLTGHEAFSGDPMQAILEAQNPHFTPAAQLADIPRELASLLDGMLEPDVARRRTTAHEAARGLLNILQRFYPGYDEFAFHAAVEALLARERQEDMDLLASLEGGTQVIKQEEIELVSLDEVTSSQERQRAALYKTVPDMASMEPKTAEISAILHDLDDLYHNG
jgi:eukaryotic-like serine/threonine-protein kinase